MNAKAKSAIQALLAARRAKAEKMEEDSAPELPCGGNEPAGAWSDRDAGWIGERILVGAILPRG